MTTHELSDPEALRELAKAIRTDMLIDYDRLLALPAVLFAAAERIEIAEELLESSIKAAVEQPARLTIELTPQGPATIREALVQIAARHGMPVEQLLEADLGDVKKFAIALLAKKWNTEDRT